MSYKQEFAENFLKKLKVVGREEIVKTDQVLVDTKTGEETVLLAKSYRKFFIDNDQFIKVFKNYIKLVEITKGLSKLAIRTIFWLMANLAKNRIDIFINIKSLSEELEISSKSKVYAAIRELIAVDIIKLIDSKTNLYEVNPSILFNGNRVEFITTIVTEKEGANGWKVTEYKEMKASKKE